MFANTVCGSNNCLSRGTNSKFDVKILVLGMSRVSKPVPRHGNSMLIRNITAAAIIYAARGKRAPAPFEKNATWLGPSGFSRFQPETRRFLTLEVFQFDTKTAVPSFCCSWFEPISHRIIMSGRIKNRSYQWIGFREMLQESPIFNGKIYGFRLRFSLKPSHW